jgi:hypothetical protein
MSDSHPSEDDRADLIERAAQWHADRPHSSTPVADLIVEFELSIAEACAALRRSEQMRVCRAFA